MKNVFFISLILLCNILSAQIIRNPQTEQEKHNYNRKSGAAKIRTSAIPKDTTVKAISKNDSIKSDTLTIKQELEKLELEISKLNQLLQRNTTLNSFQEDKLFSAKNKALTGLGIQIGSSALGLLLSSNLETAVAGSVVLSLGTITGTILQISAWNSVGKRKRYNYSH